MSGWEIGVSQEMMITNENLEKKKKLIIDGPAIGLDNSFHAGCHWSKKIVEGLGWDVFPSLLNSFLHLRNQLWQIVFFECWSWDLRIFQRFLSRFISGDWGSQFLSFLMLFSTWNSLVTLSVWDGVLSSIKRSWWLDSIEARVLRRHPF